MSKNTILWLVAIGLLAFLDRASASCNGPHESIKCLYPCPPPKTCQNRNDPIPFCPVQHQRSAVCVCDDGYYRDTDSGKCVTLEQCECAYPSCDGPHESIKSLYPCPPPKTCQNRNDPIPFCPVQHQRSNVCVCDDGYYRDDSGKCVTLQQCECESCNGPHETFKCVYPCPPARTCQNRNDPLPFCPEQHTCEYECLCDDGYYRDTDSGECYTLDQCVAANCTGPHESVQCVPSCPPPRTCENRGLPVPCPLPPPNLPRCTNQCVCDDNYYRDKSGECYTLQQCDADNGQC